MSAYRFCRTDDITLLVDALNRCRAPHFPGDPPVDAAAFKRSIRDVQVWCSSCMVAFSGAELVGVLIGAKRPSGTLVHTIAVHPDHLRQGHGRHMLTSLGSKLAILGPPRMIAEVPDTLAPASALFSACGYVEEAVLTDWVFDARVTDAPDVDRGGRFVIPVTVDDLAANGLLEDHPRVCWERSVETLMARKADVAGLAVASDERIEAWLLHAKCATRPAATPESGPRANDATAEILSLESLVEDGGARLQRLMSLLRTQGIEPVRLAKVHPEEISTERLIALGFRRTAAHRLYAADARSS